MKYVLIILLTVVLGASCGYLQYWMATRLDQKRWLLLLQPALLAAAAGCFLAWIIELDRLEDSPARLVWIPFVALLCCTLAGWIVGAVRLRQWKNRNQ